MPGREQKRFFRLTLDLYYTTGTLREGKTLYLHLRLNAFIQHVRQQRKQGDLGGKHKQNHSGIC